MKKARKTRTPKATPANQPLNPFDRKGKGQVWDGTGWIGPPQETAPQPVKQSGHCRPIITDADYRAWAALPDWTPSEAVSLFQDTYLPPYCLTADESGLDLADLEERRVEEAQELDYLNVPAPGLADPQANALRKRIKIDIDRGELKPTLDTTRDGKTISLCAPREWCRWAQANGVKIPDALRDAVFPQAASDADGESQHPDPTIHTKATVKLDKNGTIRVFTETQGKTSNEAVFMGRNGSMTKRGSVVLIMAHSWPQEVTSENLIRAVDDRHVKGALKRVTQTVTEIRDKLERAGIDPDIVKPMPYAAANKNRTPASTGFRVAKLSRPALLKSSQESNCSTVRNIGEISPYLSADFWREKLGREDVDGDFSGEDLPE